ncbi:hypothetical protein E1286_27845 [Nonomuraea terrae]|uniref:DUF885 domain-containing protein n=1 Tax=Nonomuraea terrae TaxID=2530383 RepID=A0A4R4YH22_9ACTN|nr:hypothetical protein [Nonomuraea terrae]TDD44036.1 hypothetical protein E1286_27845 [Nonomuraea terrae]
MTEHGWERDYAILALHISDLATGGTIIYRGPQEWRAQAAEQAAEQGAPPPGRLAEDADRLLEQATSPYAAANLRAFRAVARYLDGERPSLADYAEQCLGLRPRWLPEEELAAAHDRLDAALPKTPGSLAERLHAWQRAHTLRDMDRLPHLVDLAVAETRARTAARIIPLPDDEVVECVTVPEATFHAAGHYAGGHRSQIHINAGIPFNVADLLYVVAHEGHPGHIAESMFKEEHAEGRIERQVRTLLSPPFVISEGLGLHAEQLIFPGDEAQKWLTDHVLPELGIAADGSDLAAIHEVKNVLWGVWGNAAFLAAEGRSDADLAAHLSRWALYDDDEVALALGQVRPSVMSPYLFCYHHGWRLLGPWLDAPDRDRRVRRLLTEPFLPADLAV